VQLKGGKLQVLAEEQVKDIHAASLDVLEHTGVIVPERRCLEKLAEAGANVDFEKEHVLFPPWVVEEAIAKAPAHFTWHGRDPRQDVFMGDNIVNFGPASSVLSVSDIDGNKRLATVNDCEKFTRLADQSENMKEGYCVVHPSDIPDQVHHAYMVFSMFRNSTKPFRGRAFGPNEALDSIKIAEIVSGGEENMKKRPNLIVNCCPVSPLAHGKQILEGFYEYVTRRLPVIWTPEVQAGATGPVTIAGSIVQMNAEILSGLVMAQAITPGTPVVYGTVSSILDMKRGVIAYAAPEASLINLVAAQMARFYKIPSRGTGGFCDGNTLDMQAGFESAMTLLMTAMAGVNYIIGTAGAMSSTMVCSYEKFMIDDQVAGMVARLLRGVEVNPLTMATELIAKIGPKGHYMGEKHTRENLLKEHYIPLVVDRMKYDTWAASGSKEIKHLAKEKVEKILAEYQPEPLPVEVEKEIVAYIKLIEKREGVSSSLDKFENLSL
jgi:trimethylamine---corrinoid protein Co-methyltransferase